VTPQALAQAGQNLAPVTGRPSPFPVSAPLLARPPAGSSMALLQCSTPICALIGRMGQEAAGQLGTPLTVTKAGASAQSLQEAMSSIIAQKPTAVLIPAADPVQYREPMNQLDQLGIVERRPRPQRAAARERSPQPDRHHHGDMIETAERMTHPRRE